MDEVMHLIPQKGYVIRTDEDGNEYYERVETLEEARIRELTNDNNLLKQQLQAASDQNDFLEDCIAEMAEIVYA